MMMMMRMREMESKQNPDEKDKRDEEEQEAIRPVQNRCLIRFDLARICFRAMTKPMRCRSMMSSQWDWKDG